MWTGIEYAVAGLMIFEGMIAEARRIVKVARGRYDGRLREGLAAGPGGNPYNELECGKFYARAMSSWSLLIACQGLVLDGPAGILGFKPNWQPEDHRSFFTAPEGWGLFIQTRRGGAQTDEIQVRHGRITVQELVFEAPRGTAQPKVKVTIGKAAANASVAVSGSEIRVALAQPTTVTEGTAIQVVIS